MQKISLTKTEGISSEYIIKIDEEKKTKWNFMDALLSNFKEEKEWDELETLLYIKALAQLSDEEMTKIITQPLIDEKDVTEVINGSKVTIHWKYLGKSAAENMPDKILERIFTAIKEKNPSVLG